MNKYQEKLERVAKIAGEITDVVASSGVVRLALACKHGNYATAPYNHAWFCDDCWFEMVEAIQELRTFQQSVVRTPEQLDRLHENLDEIIEVGAGGE